MADDSAFLAGQFDPPSLLMFVAVEIELATGFLRLIDGASEVTFLGRSFAGLDPRFSVFCPALRPDPADGFLGSTALGSCAVDPTRPPPTRRRSWPAKTCKAARC